jgi:hypothetical protein
MNDIHPSPSRRNVIATALVAGAGATLVASAEAASASASESAATTVDPTHDGAHDFDFLIGDWKAHVRRLPERLDRVDRI